jgi:hypothetical protein
VYAVQPKETWQLTGRKIRNQRVHVLPRYPLLSKTTKINRNNQIEAAIVEDLAVIAEDELAPSYVQADFD